MRPNRRGPGIRIPTVTRRARVTPYPEVSRSLVSSSRETSSRACAIADPVQPWVPQFTYMTTMERYLAPEVQARIGLFVALGSPNDYAVPAGVAVRRYTPDAVWIEEFRKERSSFPVPLDDAVRFRQSNDRAEATPLRRSAYKVVHPDTPTIQERHSCCGIPNWPGYHAGVRLSTYQKQVPNTGRRSDLQPKQESRSF